MAQSSASQPFSEALKNFTVAADVSRMERDESQEQRSGVDRRSGLERRNGLGVLMVGCSVCHRAAPAPADMHKEGWLIVADAFGLVEITGPEHRKPESNAVPDYLVRPEAAG